MDLLLGACVATTGAKPAWKPPELRGKQLLFRTSVSAGPALILEASWKSDGERYCVEDALVVVQTPAGRIDLANANLCVTSNPPSLDGEANVAFPALGYLAGMEVDTRGRICPTFPVVGRKCLALKAR